jgi:hypothetical protein
VVPGENGNPDVRVRVYERDDRGEGTAALFWIHGGGMVLGTLDGDDFMCKTWARDFGCLVASVEYRLAPEHHYPAHIDDCYTGLRWFAASCDEHCVDQTRIVIGGASAGGGLAAGTALLARDRGEVPLHFQYLVYPMLDDRDATRSCSEITTQKVWNRRSNQIGWRSYLGDRVAGADVPIYAAPARATVDELGGLPPTYIDVGEPIRSATRTSPMRCDSPRPASRASCTSRRAPFTARRWRCPMRRAHDASAATAEMPWPERSPDGTSTRPSAWRANRPASRGCTGSSVGQGHPPKPLRR